MDLESLPTYDERISRHLGVPASGPNPINTSQFPIDVNPDHTLDYNEKTGLLEVRDPSGALLHSALVKSVREMDLFFHNLPLRFLGLPASDHSLPGSVSTPDYVDDGIIFEVKTINSLDSHAFAGEVLERLITASGGRMSLVLAICKTGVSTNGQVSEELLRFCQLTRLMKENFFSLYGGQLSGNEGTPMTDAIRKLRHELSQLELPDTAETPFHISKQMLSVMMEQPERTESTLQNLMLKAGYNDMKKTDSYRSVRRIQDYEDRVLVCETGVRRDIEHLSAMPMLVPTKPHSRVHWQDLRFTSGPGAPELFRLAAHQAIMQNVDPYLGELTEKQIEEAKNMSVTIDMTDLKRTLGKDTENARFIEKVKKAVGEERVSEQRRKGFNTVHLEPSPATNRYVSLRGRKKPLFHDPVLEQHRKALKKRTFEITDPRMFTDIEQFLMDGSWLQDSFRQTPSWEATEPLTDMYKSQCPESREFYMSMDRSHLSQSAFVLSSLSQELVISLQQVRGDNSYVFKNIPKTDVFVLVNSKGPRKNLFVVMAWPESSYKLLPIFNRCVASENGWCFNVCTVNPRTLESWVGLEQCLPVMFSSFAQDYYADPMDVLNSIRQGKWRGGTGQAVMRRLYLNFIMAVEAKVQTAGDVDNFRYAIMHQLEFSGQTPICAYVDKQSLCVRSRFLAYCLYAYNKVHKAACDTPPQMRIITDAGDDILSKDALLHYYSWMTGMEETRLLGALSDMYLGRSLFMTGLFDDAHSAVAISGKIYALEMRLRQRFHLAKALWGRKDYENTALPNWGLRLSSEPPTERFEFDASMVRAACRYAKNQIFDEIVPGDKHSSKSQREALIDKKLYNQTIADVSTFKSSVITHDPDKLPRGEEQAAKRAKTCITMTALYADGVVSERPLMDMARIIAKVEERKPYIHIFQKDTAVLREIGIMSAELRLAINFLETISLALCRYMPNEFLSKPKGKPTRVSDHMRKCQGTQRRDFIHLFDSGDSEKWSPGFIMTPFAIMIKTLFPKAYQVACMKALNFITEKMIAVPRGLKKLFEKHPDAVSYVAGINELKQEYFDGKFDMFRAAEPGRTSDREFMTCWSNFIQGSLQNTSTLYAACQSMYVRDMAADTVSKLLRKYKPRSNPTLVLSDAVTSDDFLKIYSISCSSLEPSDQVMALKLMAHITRSMMPMFCTKASVPKSAMSLGIAEFNSVWYAADFVGSPCCKFSRIASKITPAESFDTRMNLLSNLRKAILENGGSSYTAAVAQFAQAVAHYSSLGATGSRYWVHYMELLHKHPHPAVGFMTFEPERLCGLLGHDFSTWLHVKSDSRAASIERKIMRAGAMTINERGRPSVNLSMYLGGAREQARTLVRFLNKMRWSGEEAESMLNKYAINMLMNQVISPVQGLQIYSKIRSSPGAFARTSGSAAFYMQAYVLQDPCLGLKETYSTAHILQGTTEFEDKVRKVSLLSLVKIVSEMPEDHLWELDDGYLDVSAYNVANEVLLEHAGLKLLKKVINIRTAPRKALCRTTLYKNDLTGKLPLPTVLKEVWGNRIGPRGEYDALTLKAWTDFDEYRSRIRWLQPTVEETLHAFGDRVEPWSLINFIKSHAEKMSKIQVLGDRSSAILSLKPFLVENCRAFSSSCVFKEPKRTKVTSLKEHVRNALIFVSRTMSTPDPQKTARSLTGLNVLADVTGRIFGSHTTRMIDDEFKREHYNPGERLMAMFLLSRASIPLLKDVMTNSIHFNFGIFTSSSYNRKTRQWGNATFLLRNEGVLAAFTLQGQTVEALALMNGAAPSSENIEKCLRAIKHVELELSEYRNIGIGHWYNVSEKRLYPGSQGHGAGFAVLQRSGNAKVNLGPMSFSFNSKGKLTLKTLIGNREQPLGSLHADVWAKDRLETITWDPLKQTLPTNPLYLHFVRSSAIPPADLVAVLDEMKKRPKESVRQVTKWLGQLMYYRLENISQENDETFSALWNDEIPLLVQAQTEREQDYDDEMPQSASEAASSSMASYADNMMDDLGDLDFVDAFGVEMSDLTALAGPSTEKWGDADSDEEMDFSGLTFGTLDPALASIQSFFESFGDEYSDIKIRAIADMFSDESGLAIVRQREPSLDPMRANKLLTNPDVALALIRVIRDKAADDVLGRKIAEFLGVEVPPDEGPPTNEMDF